MELNMMELPGGLGDLGTLLPLLIACSETCAIRPATALLWMGFLNVLSAFAWDIPMPVQPMKAIAVAAITEPARFTAGAVAAAGILLVLRLDFLEPAKVSIY